MMLLPSMKPNEKQINSAGSSNSRPTQKHTATAKTHSAERHLEIENENDENQRASLSDFIDSKTKSIKTTGSNHFIMPSIGLFIALIWGLTSVNHSHRRLQLDHLLDIDSRHSHIFSTDYIKSTWHVHDTKA